MQLAILADIHANLPALEAVLKDLQGFDLDGTIVAGDLLGGPHPNETVDLIQSLDTWSIRGNGDSGLLLFDEGAAPDAWYTHRQFDLLRWTYQHIRKKTIDFLKTLPDQRVVDLPGMHPIRVVHGSPRDPSESIFPRQDPDGLAHALASIKERVLVCAHTHQQWAYEWDGKLALNPGAVGGPLDGCIGAQYALLTWDFRRWRAELRSVKYDIQGLAKDFRDSGLLDRGGAMARMFLASVETGRDYAKEFLDHAYRLADESGFEDCSYIPDEIWEQAVDSFPVPQLIRPKPRGWTL